MEEQKVQVIPVQDALMMIADNLENIRMPAGITAGQAMPLVTQIGAAVSGLRDCSMALAAAAEKKKTVEENDDGKADAE